MSLESNIDNNNKNNDNNKPCPGWWRKNYLSALQFHHAMVVWFLCGDDDSLVGTIL